MAQMESNSEETRIAPRNQTAVKVGNSWALQVNNFQAADSGGGGVIAKQSRSTIMNGVPISFSGIAEAEDEATDHHGINSISASHFLNAEENLEPVKNNNIISEAVSNDNITGRQEGDSPPGQKCCCHETLSPTCVPTPTSSFSNDFPQSLMNSQNINETGMTAKVTVEAKCENSDIFSFDNDEDMGAGVSSKPKSKIVIAETTASDAEIVIPTKISEIINDVHTFAIKHNPPNADNNFNAATNSETNASLNEGKSTMQFQQCKNDTAETPPQATNKPTIRKIKTREINTNNSILPNNSKSVRFAPMNQLQQYNSQCAASESLEERESKVMIHNTLRQSRKRRVPRANNFDVRQFVMRKIEFVTSSPSIQLPGMFPEESIQRLKVEGLPKSPLLKNQQSCTANDTSSFASESPLGQTSMTKLPTSLQNCHVTRHPNGKKIRVTLLHSPSHTQIIHHAMKYIHQDRDLLMEALLKWCGILQGAKVALSSFFRILPPKLGTRKLLALFHDDHYLDVLEYPPSHQNGNGPDGFIYDDDAMSDPVIQKLFAEHGLEDDCPLPTNPYDRALLWKYCLAVAGASWQAASLLMGNENSGSDVVIHWGGGRHHAHSNKAGGFCFVNDVVLAIQRLQHSLDHGIDDGILAGNPERQLPPPELNNRGTSRILYIDLDIHHPDGVQSAFYSTDKVLTASMHRHSPGFFPASSGSIREKGEPGTSGLGYNLNIPLPAGTGDIVFLRMFRKLLFGLVQSYDPHAIVLCMGADGLKGDALVSGADGDSFGSDFMSDELYDGFSGFESSSSSGEGWDLSPEGLAECVRIAAALCAGLNEDEICISPNSESLKHDQNSPETEQTPAIQKAEGKKRKLLVLGGGGYTPSQTARTQLLCTAAASEGARPGMLWSELPKDIPAHDYFPRYGPSFELVSEDKKQEIFESYATSKDASIGDGMSTSDQQILQEGVRAIDLACLNIDHQRGKKTTESKAITVKGIKTFSVDSINQDDGIWDDGSRKRKKTGAGGGRRRKKKPSPST